jgi:hypothetical protein
MMKLRLSWAFYSFTMMVLFGLWFIPLLEDVGTECLQCRLLITQLKFAERPLLTQTKPNSLSEWVKTNDPPHQHLWRLRYSKKRNVYWRTLVFGNVRAPLLIRIPPEKEIEFLTNNFQALEIKEIIRGLNSKNQDAFVRTMYSAEK